MGDMGEGFSEMRKQSRDKREKNRAESAQYLTDRKVIFTAKNGGAHLIVSANEMTIDFWPGTGLWKVRGENIEFRGVKRLMGFIDKRSL